MTTDVDSKKNQSVSICVQKSISGQSIVEFVLSLPVLLGLVMILIKINTAIQISIVNQQYARSQILFLAFNSNFYPEIKKQLDLMNLGENRFTIGVSDNLIPDTGGVQPIATEQSIVRTKQQGGSNNTQEDSPLRATVRIRDTVTLCTPTLTLGSSPIVPVLPLNSAAPYSAVGINALNPRTQWVFCQGPKKYE